MKNLLRIALILFASMGATRAFAVAAPAAFGNIAFAPGALDVSSSSQVLSLSVEASDTAGGIDSVSVIFRSPSGNQTAACDLDVTDNLSSGNPASAVLSGTVGFSPCNEPGTWSLYSVTLSDQCGNSVTYKSTAGSQALAFPPGIQTTIQVTNTDWITSTPQLVSFSFAPSGVDLTSSNHTVTVTAELSDTAAGVSSGYFYFQSPSGGQSVAGSFDSSNETSGNAYDGVYQAPITFGTCDVPGNWTLAYVDVQDPCGNSAIYGPSGSAFPKGTQTLISVTNPNADTAPPALAAFGLSSTEADIGTGEVKITGSAVATDNGSGVASGFINYTGTSGGSISFSFSASSLLAGSVLDGTFGGEMDVGTCATPGTYTLNDISVYDHCDNVAYYGGSGAPLPSGVPSRILVVNSALSTGAVSVDIYPSTAEWDGTTWSVDGGVGRYNQSPVTGLSPGQHMISFAPLNRFTAPAAQYIEVVAGQTAYTSGTYTPLTPGDSIQVNILPAGTAGMWTLDDGPLQSGGATVSGLYDGTHTIQFSNVSGYTAPASQVITTASNLAFVTTGTYSQITEFGMVSVTISPSGAIHNGAMWNVDGGASQSSGSTVSGIAVGQHLVNFSSANGYTAPESQAVQVNENATTLTTGTYTPSLSSTGSLTVTILPASAVKAGAQWNIDGGVSEKSGTKVTGISGGDHTVNFTMTNGYIAPASQLVSIIPNGSTATTGTYRTAPGFSGAAQSFIGLSASGNALLAMSMMSNGKFTGKFEIAGAPTLVLSGSLSLSGSFSGVVGRKPPLPYAVQVTGTSSSTYLLTGSANGIQITAYPDAYAKGQTAAELGKYNSLLYPATMNAPEGDGYGSISVGKTGVASIAGKLADGTGFTASNALVAGSGGNVFIVYDTSLYAKKGLLSGMLAFVSGSGSASGTLNWIKPASKASYYAAGFNAGLRADCQRYASGAIPFTTGTVALLGGALGSPIIEPFAVVGGKVTITGTSNPADVTLKITPATGAISGTVLLPGAKKPVKVKYNGLLLQTPGFPRAAGFFLTPVISGSGQSGAVVLPQPPA
ncbi:MAG TPA: hypothetical protein VHY22_07080 [Chthoniobacteraceae bacterium]|jgi:hypothetical protein|nr:hypothetical protein [Chthoniobacteraceae bacterium]